MPSSSEQTFAPALECVFCVHTPQFIGLAGLLTDSYNNSIIIIVL